MSAEVAEIRLVALSLEAHRTVCGLVQPTEEIDPAEVSAVDAIWTEVRAVFPADEACLDEDGPGAPAGSSAAETRQVVVLEDGGIFSGLEGCRIFEVPADWGAEEIEDALSEVVARE